MQFLSKIACVLACFLLLTCQEEIRDAGKDGIETKHLISVKTLQEWLNTQKPLTLFEVSKDAVYNKGHLPTAQHLWRPNYTSTKPKYDGMIAPAWQLKNLLSAKGALAHVPIILYDAKGGSDAMRVLWLLQLYGHKEVYVLNGGKVAWQQAGYPLEHHNRIPLRTLYQFDKKANFDTYATLEDVEAAILDSNTLLIDTREVEEYQGKSFEKKGKKYDYKKGAYAAGRIPTAIHFNWSNAVDLKDDHRIKSLNDLRYDLERAGITPHKKIITYCHSGVRSAHTAYVLKEILGYPHVKNYDGSWIEWSYYYTKDQSVPIQ